MLKAKANLSADGIRLGIRVKGIVQGVGFRPFVYRLAQAAGLSGLVFNDEQGVWIEIQGQEKQLEQFIAALRHNAPPLAAINDIVINHLPLTAASGFIIRESPAGTKHRTLISPDIATCIDCQHDIADPANRRYRYAFTNCTNCGPRYSIVTDVPYDRANTTMAQFPMCENCLTEYKKITDRRFHAQPNACMICGPEYKLYGADWRMAAGDPLARAAEKIRDGAIIAVKGIGGYHLVCDARSEAAVTELRRRKRRRSKPLAVMCATLADIKTISSVSAAEGAMLSGTVRPIVLLTKTVNYSLAAAVAPGTQYIGVMLPYAPPHFIMLKPGDIWVMTSANYSDLPLIYQDGEAKEQLVDLADYFLTHNRRIQCRIDDSVTRIFANKPYLIRRSRGLAPAPIHLSKAGSSVIAVGGEQKNTFCLTNHTDAFVSTHSGDLENMAVFTAYQQLIEHDKRLFGIEPSVVACDLHPEYLSTKYAKSLALPTIAVQHHHAHIASVLAEHNETDTVIGVAFDGTGYGTDGKIWGGEFLLADCQDFQRIAQFNYLPLPGGSQAIRQPWRQAAWVLQNLYGQQFMEYKFPLNKLLPPKWQLAITAAECGINTPFTSSVGRLFDTAAALLGICTVNKYDGQAAAALELAAKNMVGRILPYDIKTEEIIKVDFSSVLGLLAAKAAQGEPISQLAADFHTTVADAVITLVQKIGRQYNIKKAALSGGVFQNILLLRQVLAGLEPDFTILLNRQVPPNDGGLSLGQAAVARERMR